MSDENRIRAAWTFERFLVMFAPTILILILGALLLWGSLSLSAQSARIRDAELKNAILEHMVWLRSVQISSQDTKLDSQAKELERQADRLDAQRQDLLQRERDHVELEALYELQTLEERRLSAALSALRSAILDTESMRFYQHLVAKGVARASAIWELGGGKTVGVSRSCEGSEKLIQTLRSRIPLVISVADASEQERLSEVLKALCSDGVPSYAPNYPSRLLREYAIRLAKEARLFEQFAEWCPKHPDLTFVSPVDHDSVSFHRFCRDTIAEWLMEMDHETPDGIRLMTAFQTDLWSDAGFKKRNLDPDAAGVRLLALARQDSRCGLAPLSFACGQVLVKAASTRFGRDRPRNSQVLACAAQDLFRMTTPACDTGPCALAAKLCNP